MERNPLFCGILLITAVLQVIMVEFGGLAMHVVDGGLDGKYWAISMAFGAGSLPLQQVINLVYKTIGEKSIGMWRERRRVDLSRRISTMHIDRH
jgi:hypothetical protein